MRTVTLKIKKIAAWRHTCGSANVKWRFARTRNSELVRDRMTGESRSIRSNEYREHRVCKACLDCKSCDCLGKFYNPLYRTRMECLICGRETQHEHDHLRHKDMGSLYGLTCLECRTEKVLQFLRGRTFAVLEE